MTTVKATEAGGVAVRSDFACSIPAPMLIHPPTISSATTWDSNSSKQWKLPLFVSSAPVDRMVHIPCRSLVYEQIPVDECNCLLLRQALLEFPCAIQCTTHRVVIEAAHRVFCRGRFSDYGKRELGRIARAGWKCGVNGLAARLLSSSTMAKLRSVSAESNTVLEPVEIFILTTLVPVYRRYAGSVCVECQKSANILGGFCKIASGCLCWWRGNCPFGDFSLSL